MVDTEIPWVEWAPICALSQPGLVGGVWQQGGDTRTAGCVGAPLSDSDWLALKQLLNACLHVDRVFAGINWYDGQPITTPPKPATTRATTSNGLKCIGKARNSPL